jgi:signal transduction histidine kinase
MLRRSLALDWGIALAGAALTEWIVWTGKGIGTAVAGPRWLTAGWPLLLDLPLAWRRRAPLFAWCLVLAGVNLQALWTGNSAEGLEVILPIAVGIYSVAAYSGRRGAFAGLALLAVGYTVFSLEDRGVKRSDSGSMWSAAFFGVAAVAIWFAGVWIRSRRDATVLAERAADLEHEAHVAVTEERARMARELHDIVSHNLSVVVLQAAGARAAGASAGTLEKIERSGREALVEMRRLLGVLREDSSDASLTPQPGIADIHVLAASVRAAGVPVELEVDGDYGTLPPAVELSAYRIVQEALTNVLKHAKRAHAEVRVRRDGDVLTVEVLDDGVRTSAAGTGGHGLVGMRERVALFGGELHAGPRSEGGFAVHATLPVVG